MLDENIIRNNEIIDLSHLDLKHNHGDFIHEFAFMQYMQKLQNQEEKKFQDLFNKLLENRKQINKNTNDISELKIKVDKNTNDISELNPKVEKNTNDITKLLNGSNDIKGLKNAIVNILTYFNEMQKEQPIFKSLKPFTYEDYSQYNNIKNVPLFNNNALAKILLSPELDINLPQDINNDDIKIGSISGFLVRLFYYINELNYQIKNYSSVITEVTSDLGNGVPNVHDIFKNWNGNTVIEEVEKLRQEIDELKKGSN